MQLHFHFHSCLLITSFQLFLPLVPARIAAMVHAVFISEYKDIDRRKVAYLCIPPTREYLSWKKFWSKLPHCSKNLKGSFTKSPSDIHHVEFAHEHNAHYLEARSKPCNQTRLLQSKPCNQTRLLNQNLKRAYSTRMAKSPTSYDFL